MRKLANLGLCCALLLLAVAGCTKKTAPSQELMHYPLDGMDGVISRTGVAFDPVVSSDGHGSLHITTNDSTTIRLFETGDVNVENAALRYQAMLRTKDVQGQVYLEMWCGFPGMGEYFSRGLHSQLTGSQGWNSQQTSFVLKKGENPDQVRLNLVVTGPGEVWIDDIHLTAAPLE